MTKEQLLYEIKNLTAKDRQWLLAEAKKADKVSIKVAKAAFINFYRGRYKEEYYWEGKDSGSMEALLRKIRIKMEEAKFTPINDHTIADHLIHFCTLAVQKDQWIANHFAVANLNGQFNILYNKVNYGTTNSGLSKDYIEQLFSD